MLLAAGGVVGVAIAGCTDVSVEVTPAADGTSEQGSGDATQSGSVYDDLDLREANVTALDVESVNGAYQFSVTLLHDDDGEDGYANWWQVEDMGGERLGRRDLTHPHGTREFTRSATVSIPDDVDCVVVRGHDQTHGYGGQAMLFALDSGTTRTVQQGSEPRDVSPADCPS